MLVHGHRIARQGVNGGDLAVLQDNGGAIDLLTGAGQRGDMADHVGRSFAPAAPRLPASRRQA